HDVPVADAVLGALARVGAERLDPQVQLADGVDVADRAVDHDALPAVVHRAAGDEVAHEGRLQRAAPVDHQDAAGTGLGEGGLDEGVVPVAPDGGHDAGEAGAAAVLPKLHRAGLQVLPLLVVEVSGAGRLDPA